MTIAWACPVFSVRVAAGGPGVATFGCDDTCAVSIRAHVFVRHAPSSLGFLPGRGIAWALFSLTSSAWQRRFLPETPTPTPLPTSTVAWMFLLTFMSQLRHLLQKACLIAPGSTRDGACVPSLMP